MTGTPVTVHAERIERFAEHFRGPVDVITARALAPLSDLLELSSALLVQNNVRGLFLKGRDAEAELREAAKSWMMDVTLIPSRTDPLGRIIAVTALRPRPDSERAGQTDEK